MYRSIIALAAAAGMLVATGFTAASAADLPRSVSPAPASYNAPYNWTGFYLGINVGYTGKGSFNEDPMPTNWYGDSLGTINPKGFSGGITAGYNYQWNKVVLGLETDINWSNIGGGQDSNLCAPYCGSYLTATENRSMKMPWFGTLRARLGFTPWERILVYGTAGLAYGKVETTDNYTYNYSDPWWGSYSYASQTNRSDFRVGRALGAGVEVAITNNVTMKGEWLHMKMNGPSSSSCSSYSFGYRYCSSSSSDITNNLVRVGLNYKF